MVSWPIWRSSTGPKEDPPANERVIQEDGNGLLPVNLPGRYFESLRVSCVWLKAGCLDSPDCAGFIVLGSVTTDSH